MRDVKLKMEDRIVCTDPAISKILKTMIRIACLTMRKNVKTSYVSPVTHTVFPQLSLEGDRCSPSL